MEGGIWKVTAPKLHLRLPTVDHIITDILIDVSKEGEAALYLAGMISQLLLSGVRKKPNREDNHMCLSAASLTSPFELCEK